MPPSVATAFHAVESARNARILELIAHAVTPLLAKNTAFRGSHYAIQDGKVSIEPANRGDEPFAAGGACLFEWIEPEQLFGCVRITMATLPCNRVWCTGQRRRLILSARALLAQPLLWLRLKQMIGQRQFHWVSPDETRPLPVAIPPMPLDLRLIVVGDRHGTADFHDIEPELSEQAVYGEYEDDLQLTEVDDMAQWCGYVNGVIADRQLPMLAADARPPLIVRAVRYTGDQGILPLSPVWLGQQLSRPHCMPKRAHYRQSV